MTARCLLDDTCFVSRAPRRDGPRARRAAVAAAIASRGRACSGKEAKSDPSAQDRPAQRLRRILSANPRARHFSVRRIVAALGDSPCEPTLALFSATGVFGADDLGCLSGFVTGTVGARMVLRRDGVWLPRSVLRRKIPRRALSEVIRAVCLVLDIAEGHARPRWRWVFHPAMSVILGLLIFLLALASVTPILGMAAHLGPAFIMSVGLAERDGLAVMIGALAGVALLARATMSLVPGRPLLTTTRNWLHACFKRMRLRSAAWLLDRLDQGLGALLRVRWSNLLLLFAADVSVGVDPSVYSRQTLRRRVHRIRAAQQLKAAQPTGY